MNSSKILWFYLIIKMGVLLVSDRSGGIAILNSSCPDLILLDITMPEVIQKMVDQ
ncbi:hypothetical protein [Shewanella sp. GutDb-MelDb]|uniref:hypothetical protein n=1 Tax=Shewanella sp. GutDb-MelDb TaxID=2058316 RepID=UPI00215306E0|nr:hypothetical protein [Shewanella sp. GutDb-MelDb]